MEKTKTNKLFKLVFVTMLIFSLSVSYALAVTEGEVWEEWGYNNAGTQNRLGASSMYGDVSNFTTNTQSTYGTEYQPLVDDLDFDDSLDIVIQSTNYLLVYDNEMGLTAQYTATLTGQPTLTQTSDLDNDGFTAGESYILAHNDTEVYMYDFNGSVISQIYNLNVSDDENVSLGNNGFKCFYESTVLNSEVCMIKYLSYPNRSLTTRDTGGILSIVIPDTCHNTSCITTTYWDFVALNNSIATIPQFFDLDQSGSKDVIFWSDLDQDGVVGFSVFTTTAQSTLLVKDNIIDLAAAGLTQTVTDAYGSNNPIMYDLNTGGHGEVYFGLNSIHRSWTVGTNTDGSRVYCYDSVGATCTGYPQYITSYHSSGAPHDNTFRTSNLVVNEIEGEDVLCALASGAHSHGGTPSTVGGCVDKDGDLVHNTTIGGYLGEQLFVTGADFDNDGNDDLVSHRYLWDLEAGTDLLNYTTDNWVIPIDLNGDNYLDMLFINDSEIKTSLTSGSNDDPEIDEVSSNTGTPSCINEEIDFTITDYTDTEFNMIQLRIDCENNGTFTDWSSLSYAPSADCTYSSYGTKSVVFSIRDSAHTAEGDRVTCSWNVDAGNCYEAGEGSTLVCESTATGDFNDYGFNLTEYEFDDTIDGYHSTKFDWDGTGCNNWTAMRGFCPIVVVFKAGMGELWDWIFDNFAIMLLLLVIVIGASVTFYKVNNRE